MLFGDPAEPGGEGEAWRGIVLALDGSTCLARSSVSNFSPWRGDGSYPYQGNFVSVSAIAAS